MSNIGAIGIIVGIFTVVFLVAVYVLMRIQERADVVVTGYAGGSPVSTEYRWVVLFNTALPGLAFLVVYVVLASLAMLTLARTIDDESVRSLAHLTAAIGGFGALFLFLQGTVFVLHLASELRKVRKKGDSSRVSS